MEVVVGHLTFCFLVRRPLLTTFSVCYAFIRAGHARPVEMWAAVRRELWWAVSLLPLARAELSAPWWPWVTATDASPSGYGVMYSRFEKDDVSRVARVSERWRHGRDDEAAVSARAHALVERHEPEGLGASESEEEEASRVEGFPEVPEAMTSGKWLWAAARPWAAGKSMPVWEARAAMWGLRHIARARASHGSRVLCLVDALSIGLMLSKGRSSSLPRSPVVCGQFGHRHRCSRSMGSQ